MVEEGPGTAKLGSPTQPGKRRKYVEDVYDMEVVEPPSTGEDPVAVGNAEKQPLGGPPIAAAFSIEEHVTALQSPGDEFSPILLSPPPSPPRPGSLARTTSRYITASTRLEIDEEELDGSDDSKEVGSLSPVLHLPLAEKSGEAMSPQVPALLKPFAVAAAVVQDETRIHPRSARELEMVDETPGCLICPTLGQAGSLPLIGRYEDSLGAGGRAKAFRGPVMVSRGSVTAYGEDYTATSLLLTPSRRPDGSISALAEVPAPPPHVGRLLAVFDGHGMRGKDAGRLAAEKLVEESQQGAVEQVKALLAGDVTRVKAIQQERYMRLDKHVHEVLRSPTGGTTCSTVEVLGAGGRVFLVSSNVGDSPVLLIDNRTCKSRLISGRHSWENPHERQAYLDRCASLGLEPREVVYGRINCGGMRMVDMKGGMAEPLLVYKPGTALVDEHTRNHLCQQVERKYRNSIGGSQSIRRFVLERRTSSGDWEVFKAMEEHGHVNWGATVLVNGEGKIQMTRSLGDLHEKHTAHIWSSPDTAMCELGPNEDWTVLACSDGIADLWYFSELAELAAEFWANADSASVTVRPTAQQLVELILERTMERGTATPGYGVAPKVDECPARPKWDDISLVCLRIKTSPAPPRPPSRSSQPPLDGT